MAENVRLSSNGRVTIPKEIRDGLGLRPGDEVVVRLDGSRAVVEKAGAVAPQRATTTAPVARTTAAEEVSRGARVDRVTTAVRPGRR